MPCIHLGVTPFTFLKHEGNLVCLRSHVVDVVLVRWPKENEHRDRLAREGRPRLLLLEAGVLPPLVEDPLEDWVRIPAPDTDVRARLDTLALRARLRAPSQPTLDDDGVIRHNGLWASLPPVEARITRLLLDRLGAVVSRESLSPRRLARRRAGAQRPRRPRAPPPPAPGPGRPGHPHRPVPGLPARADDARTRPRSLTRRSVLREGPSSARCRSSAQCDGGKSRCSPSDPPPPSPPAWRVSGARRAP